MTIYLDCNATSPVEPEVLETVLYYMKDEYGNAGSRTHEFGARAKQAVERARDAVAEVVNADSQEVIFTSGATESNNLALLGLAAEGKRTGRKHIVTSAIEHKAVLEPLEHLVATAGFELTLIPPLADGYVAAEDVAAALRPDTLLVSVMQVNNETGVIQPILEIAERLRFSDAFFHVDAAQGFGKELAGLRNERIDLISVSGHKIYGPKGVGALITRRRDGKRLPLSPLMFGGGQEHSLRPGTLPVHLIAGLGTASVVALRDRNARLEQCKAIRQDFKQSLNGLQYLQNGAEDRCILSTLNISVEGVDSEAAMVALKGIIGISNGSACTSARYISSHVLQAMRQPADRIAKALRFSWSHLTPPPPWDAVRDVLSNLAS